MHVNGCYRMNVNVEYSREVPLKIAKQDTRSRKYDLCDVPQDDVILVMFLRLRITNLYIFSYSLKVDSVFYYCSNNRTLSQSRALDNFMCVCVRSCVCVCIQYVFRAMIDFYFIWGLVCVGNAYHTYESGANSVPPCSQPVWTS